MATVGRRPGRGEQGFGLLEVILSLTVLLLVLIASSYLVDNVVQQAAFNRQRVAAAELAEQYLETTSNATLSSLQADISKDVLLTATPVSVGGINYSVWSHLEWAGTGSSPSLCASGNPPQVIRATMTVKWGQGKSMGETSIIDPPYGTVIPGDGFLSIQIYGASAPKPPADTTSLINVPVTVTPITTLNTALVSGTKYTSISVAGLTSAVASSDSITLGSGSSAQVVTASAAKAAGTGTQTISVSQFTATSSFAAGTAVADAAWGGPTVYNPDQNGCVYLQEPLGKYSVSLASPTGGPSFIDYQEYATPGVTGQNPVTVTVATAGLPAYAPTFHYDESGTVTMTPSAGAPLASGMPITVSNGGNLQPTGTDTIVPYGSSTSVVSLFPYTAPYSVWYGDCTTQAGVTQEQPTAPTTFSLSPQGAATASITGLTTLPITVTRTGNAAFSAAPTATATVNDTSAPGDGCPSVDKTGGEVFTLAGATPTTVGSTTSYTTQTAVMNQTYTVTVHDPSNNSNTPFAMVVGATGVTYNSTLYAPGTAVPVVVS